MRYLLALAFIARLVTAGKLYAHRGTSHYFLDPFTAPADIPVLRPAGNYTNSTIFKEKIYVNTYPLA